MATTIPSAARLALIGSEGNRLSPHPRSLSRGRERDAPTHPKNPTGSLWLPLSQTGRGGWGVRAPAVVESAESLETMETQ